MKRNTIKWHIFKYNILAIIVLITLITVIFNIAVRLYFKEYITEQLYTIANHAENTVLKRGPDFFPPAEGKDPQPPPRSPDNSPKAEENLYMFYFMLDRSLTESLSVLNADYILLDRNKNSIAAPPQEYFKISNGVLDKVLSEIDSPDKIKKEKHIGFKVNGIEYLAIIKPVTDKNAFGLGWIITYSSLQKVNELLWRVNAILLAIILFSAFMIGLFSSLAAKKISAPFTCLNQYISEISERNFSSRINMPVDDEFQNLVKNINVMSEKLDTYDKAQKTFLQNASHEFRTPLMSIQSYTEGIMYDVIDNKTAGNIILNETKRMTRLVEDLLYLSRLDTIEENYHFGTLDFNVFIGNCIDRVKGIAANLNVKITARLLSEDVELFADDEKLSRAITNILSNCIRYSQRNIGIAAVFAGNGTVRLIISDDGPGFEAAELPYIFDRFFKGKTGGSGLGLAISRQVIEKHGGNITACNSGTGAQFTVELPYKSKRHN